jgi:hypothetical protein
MFPFFWRSYYGLDCKDVMATGCTQLVSDAAMVPYA